MVNIGEETEQIEFKKSTGELKEGIISIASILNKHGSGALYFGVKNNGDVIGQEICNVEFRTEKDDFVVAFYRNLRETWGTKLSDMSPNVTQDVTEAQDDKSLDERILELIKSDSKITTKSMAEKLGVSDRTVKRHIAAMSNVNYIGSGYSGHWEISED
jgi:predicted HTH transcriptional regulator